MEIHGEATPAVELVRQMKLGTGEGQDLVALVESRQKADRSGLEALVSRWFPPDVEWDLSQSRWASLGFRTYRGYEEWFGYWRELLEVFSEFRFQTEWLRAAGEDRVLGVASSSGSFRETGLPWSDQSFEIWTVRDGKVSRLQFFDSREAAEREAGA
jgi:ketosteroid isomerase-like protein